MTDNFTPPSIDPASRNDISGTIRFILTKFLQGVDDMLPAIVIAYDRTTNRARVQPLISVVTTSNEVVQRPQIASIPVLQLGGGGFVISFPIKTGDLGWIKANDRDISIFLQTLQSSEPNTARKHDFSDAVFIPDTMFKSVVINSEDQANVVLQTLDGTVRVAIWDNKVKVTAPTVEVVAPQVTVTSTNADVTASAEAHVSSPTITLTGSTEIVLDSPLTTITGALAAGTGAGDAAVFSGPISTSQTVMATGEITSGSIPLTTHRHTGVQTGGGDTGGAIP